MFRLEMPCSRMETIQLAVNIFDVCCPEELYVATVRSRRYPTIFPCRWEVLYKYRDPTQSYGEPNDLYQLANELEICKPQRTTISLKGICLETDAANDSCYAVEYRVTCLCDERYDSPIDPIGTVHLAQLNQINPEFNPELNLNQLPALQPSEPYQSYDAYKPVQPYVPIQHDNSINPQNSTYFTNYDSSFTPTNSINATNYSTHSPQSNNHKLNVNCTPFVSKKISNNSTNTDLSTTSTNTNKRSYHRKDSYTKYSVLHKNKIR